MKNLFLFSVCVILGVKGISQDNVVAKFSFQDCSTQDEVGFLSDAVLVGDTLCDCGMEDQSIILDGIENQVVIDDTLLGLFSADFTVDFYVNLTDVFVPTALFSIQTTCSVDSAFTLRFFPQTREIVLDISEDVANNYRLRGEISNHCWTRVTFTRSRLDYTLYIDSKRVALEQVDKEIPVGRNAEIAVGSSKCVGQTDARLDGKIDELTFYNKALSERDLFQNFLYPNRIITSDTTIYTGGSVFIAVGASCFEDFTWSPVEGLDNPDNLDVIASPTVTTNYNLSIVEENCEVEEEITVYVVNEEDQQCNDLLLPTGFTPNGDLLNDDFGISNQFIVDELNEFNIYDRWGDKVFSTQSKSGRWDGSFQGKLLPGGDYSWWISYTCRNESYSKAGHVMMLK